MSRGIDWHLNNIKSLTKKYNDMWMTQYASEVKRQFREVYKFTPKGGTETEPLFEHIPDGEYPMTIEGSVDTIVIKEGKMSFKFGEKPIEYDKTDSPHIDGEEDKEYREFVQEQIIGIEYIKTLPNTNHSFVDRLIAMLKKELEGGDGWIQVNWTEVKTMPANDGKFLILEENGNVDVDTYLLRYDSFDKYGRNVTHWQPLPQPPVKVNKYEN